MDSRERYLQIHSTLVEFMKPIADKHCSPCQHNRGECGCCTGGPFLYTKIEKELNESVQPILQDSLVPCAYLEKGIGCVLKHKSATCLTYLCAPIHNLLSLEDKKRYWDLREELSETIGELEENK